jgi:hypothetical protein
MMETAAAYSVNLLMIVLYFLWMNQSITTIISKDIILLYKCTDEYRANIQMVKRGDTHHKFAFIPISKAHSNK